MSTPEQSFKHLLRSFTSLYDVNISLRELLIEARTIAVCNFPCTSSAADEFADADIVARAVTRAIITLIKRSPNVQVSEEHMQVFLDTFEYLWDCMILKSTKDER